MAQPQEQEGISKQEDRERLSTIETNQTVMSGQMSELNTTVKELASNVNKLVVSVTKNTESNHHLADRVDRVSQRQDAQEDRTFGKGGLADQVNELKVRTGISKAQLGIIGAGAIVLVSALATWYFSNASMLSELSELTESLRGLQ